jgi:hypothetical protein
MIFWLWEVQKGTSSLHREMERPSEQVAWGVLAHKVIVGHMKLLLIPRSTPLLSLSLLCMSSYKFFLFYLIKSS